MDRRRFLRLAGMAGASVFAACATPPTSASPTPTAAPIETASPSPTATLTGRVPDWSALARTLKGELIRPSDPTYDARRVLYNTRFDAIRPDAIARCVSVDDVRECVAFAAFTGVPLALRSGGHSYGGWSTGRGLVIDTGPLNAIDVRADRVVVGPGARLIDIYAETARAGAGITGGSCATVGIAGLALGGGIGVMSRVWGLTCDDLLAAEIVTADANILTCDGQREPDLFWALRGGGGGSFGVVTSLMLRTHPASALALGFLSWPWSAAKEVIAAWQEWMRLAPDALWSNLRRGSVRRAAHPLCRALGERRLAQRAARSPRRARRGPREPLGRLAVVHGYDDGRRRMPRPQRVAVPSRGRNARRCAAARDVRREVGRRDRAALDRRDRGAHQRARRADPGKLLVGHL